MQTDNLELKKLVYLYLMNYAKSQPDMAIMAVNTFVKVRGTLEPHAAAFSSTCIPVFVRPPREAAVYPALEKGAWAGFQILSPGSK